MAFDDSELAALDKHGFTVVNALHHESGPTSTHSHPCKFVCMDGRTYWTKGEPVQQGLAVELIAARLAGLLGAGPSGAIINVSEAALPANPGCSTGLLFGSLDQNDMINARDLGRLGLGTIEPSLIDKYSWGLVIVFQTWLDVRDSQVLINVTNGRVATFDHGDCFGRLADSQPARVVFTRIDGLDQSTAKAVAALDMAVDKIEAVTDGEILSAVSNMPVGPTWRSDAMRRLSIANWLQHRRTLVRGTIESWRTT
jgi:hypothetical protein